MGAFNTVRAPAVCPRCGVTAEFEVQFKFGDTWQHRYHIGDSLRWGGNDVGRPGLAEVVVAGLGGPCPSCGTDFLDFEVIIVGDRVDGVRPAPPSGPDSGPEGFVIVRK